MNHRSKIVNWGTLVLMCIVFACSNHENGKTSHYSAEKEEGYPDIKFDTTYHDFGRLIQGEQVSYTFKFRNTGTSSLIIKDAFSTCGCTVPNFSKEPIKAGQEGEIEVVFNSEGKQGLQYKTVTLQLNTIRKEKTLTIKAHVLANNYKS